ncbi:STAS domain-containing protein [Candidatus Sumerlaeota bacterium]|nr:STAS domain-containing protein [Candidatus Sumerlaeota bacterium]
MEIQLVEHQGCTVAKPQIDVLNTSNSRELLVKLDAITADQQKIVLDLSMLSFIDSSGIGSLLTMQKHQLQNNGILYLCGLSDTVDKVLRQLQLNRVFSIVKTADEAVAELGG